MADDIRMSVDDEFLWRLKQLELVGIDRFPAVRLAMCSADWHVIAKAAQDGATDQQLLDLFLDDE